MSTCTVCGNEEDAPVTTDVLLIEGGTKTYGKVINGECAPCRHGRELLEADAEAGLARASVAKLGDFVQTPMYRGRVTAIHHCCPEDEGWLAGQVFLNEQERTGRGVWLSVLVHGGGSIAIPAGRATVIAEFKLNNNWADYYFHPQETT